MLHVYVLACALAMPIPECNTNTAEAVMYGGTVKNHFMCYQRASLVMSHNQSAFKGRVPKILCSRPQGNGSVG